MKYGLRQQRKNVFFIITFCYLLYILYFWIEYYDNNGTNIYSLEKDGLCILYDKEYLQSVNTPCKKLKQDILRCLPEGYEFINYVYEIENTSLSMFHRDVTSSKMVYKTKHPVYTAILYKYDGELLSVCPGSNFTYPFVLSPITNISGKKGTVFLFDCDLLHAGMKNMCKDRKVLQYKLCHHTDLYLLRHLQNIYAKKNDVCKISMRDDFIRKMTYYFQFPINVWLYPLMIKREPDDSIIGSIQSYIPLTYYNNI